MTEEEVNQRLQEKYPNAQIQVHDMTGAGSNFQVYIKSESFKDLSRVKRHQEVMSVFDAELKSGEVHALTIKAED